MRELYEVRLAIEELARFVHADERFHRQLAGASGNDVAAAMLGDLNDRIRILRIYDFTTDAGIGATISEHMEILGRVLARDVDGAAAFMRAHVQRLARHPRARGNGAGADVRAAGATRAAHVAAVRPNPARDHDPARRRACGAISLAAR